MSEQGQLLIAAVRNAADRNPFHIFQGTCLYVANGDAACLVGHGLWDMGVIDSTLQTSQFNDEGVGKVLEWLGIQVDDAELEWLEDVQEAQDCRHTWQDSIRGADEVEE